MRPTPPKQTKCQACPLKKLEVFRAVSPKEIAFIEEFKSGEFVTDAGATILAEGTSGPHLFTVLSGWAFRYKMLSDGRRQILNFVLPGDFIGLQSSMLNEMQHSVEALTKMVLCVFPRDKLWDLYSNHPSLAFDLTWLASRSERLLDENLLSVGRRSAAERVAFVILDIFRRCRQVGLVQGQKAEFPFTQQHLADALGLSLVHTNKTMQQLIARKLFRWKGGVLEILDEKRLEESANLESVEVTIRPLI
jgi:CRP/FNR family transcriptional regulator, anaerobic regulatory protein